MKNNDDITMENYRFSVPIRINYIADESTISIMCLEDLEEVQEKYGVDLNFVINEYEYKVDMEKDAIEDDEEYMAMGDDEIFDDVIQDNWDEIIEKLNKECELNDLSDEDVEKIFGITKDSFEKSVNIKDFEETYKDQNYKLLSINMVGFNKTKSEFHIIVKVSKKLKKDEIEYIRGWVESLTSEKWGEGFSKTDLSDKIDTEDVYVYLLPWSMNKEEVKYIK